MKHGQEIFILRCPNNKHMQGYKIQILLLQGPPPGGDKAPKSKSYFYSPPPPPPQYLEE